MPNIIGTAAAGFQDASLWEEAKKKGSKEIKRMIDKALKNTSVTVVFVTSGTTASATSQEILCNEALLCATSYFLCP